MECNICYEHKKGHQIKTLECMHSLCKECYNKLRNNTCPFCRREIKGKKKYNECINNIIQVVSNPRISIEKSINNLNSQDIIEIFSSKIKNNNRKRKVEKKRNKKKKNKLLKNKNKYNSKKNKNHRNNIKDKYNLIYNNYFSD
jgi:hypothetical protein